MIKTAIRGVDLDRLLIETDAPYLVKRPCQVLLLIAEWVGDIKGCCAAIILEANRRNAIRLFSLPPAADLGL
jgi:Tat protein secretion system quality control protein TatD with DNase activity